MTTDQKIGADSSTGFPGASEWLKETVILLSGAPTSLQRHLLFLYMGWVIGYW
ncbi:hypothetical protein JXI42_10375 [bacterium]|nr:hypothetical protein [bacterium]